MPPRRYTTDQVFDALRAAAEAKAGLGGSPTPPSQREYNEWRAAHPEAPTKRLIEKRHGTWTQALRDAGFDVAPGPQNRRRWSEYDILEAVVSCAEEIGHRPSPGEYDLWARDRDTPQLVTVVERFGLWITAIREAGFS
jgi:hypothetical protein